MCCAFKRITAGRRHELSALSILELRWMFSLWYCNLLFCTNFYVALFKCRHLNSRKLVLSVSLYSLVAVSLFHSCCSWLLLRAALLQQIIVCDIDFLLGVFSFPFLNACHPGFFSLKPVRGKRWKRSLLPPLSHWLQPYCVLFMSSSHEAFPQQPLLCGWVCSSVTSHTTNKTYTQKYGSVWAF